MKRNPLGGGVAIAVLSVAGAWIGARHGQPTAGLLIGLAAGAAIAFAVWLWEQR